MKERWNIYVAILIFIIGLFFFSRSLYSYENKDAIQKIRELSWALKYEDCKTFPEKVRFHEENAKRCYDEAKAKCWYLPDIDDRRNADYCFYSASGLLYPGTPMSKLMGVLINLLIQYGIDCTKEWHDINHKLYWAEYHFEMKEFYEDLQKKR